MRKATIRELRKDYGRLSASLEKAETIQLLKRDKPFARVVSEPQPRGLLGSMAGTAKVPRDIDEHTGVSWEAEG